MTVKKKLALILALVLSACLCACGGDIEVPTRTEELVTAPTRPESIAVPESFAEETEKGTESAEGKYPWEMEFREEDYTKLNFTAPNGDKVVYWREGGMFGMDRREIYEWADTGFITDTYYYPSGNPSHCYQYHSDGTFIETHCLDNGYTDANGTSYSGVCIYQKTVKPDGYWNEMYFDENGNLDRLISVSSEWIEHSEYYENGNVKHSVFEGADGNYSEEERYENGNVKRYIFEDTTGNYYEQEYYEDGTLKYVKNQSPESTMEERYDEEGYRTYFYNKNSSYECELIADESGKLVCVTENGTVIEDAAALAQYAANYNFRQ